MAVHALKHGAVDVIEKPYKKDDLAVAIRNAIDRSAKLRKSLTELADDRQRFESLTPGELQVLDLIIAGTSQKRVVHLLKISRRTVNRLSGRVYSKMGVNTVAELAGVISRLRSSAP